MFNVPILFLVFKRPETTQRVFDVLKVVKPKYLFIAADGPRNNNIDEIEKCKEVRSIINQIDWDCDLKTLFRDENLGCKIAVSTGISWFFGNVEEGIILEDDTLPSFSFFQFCEEMLKEYRFDNSVTGISGFNLMGEYSPNNSDYFFSRIIGIWGWASWRRVWNHYDVNIKSWGMKKDRKSIFKHLVKRKWLQQLSPFFDKTFKKEFDTWDYQWIYTQLYLNGLVITPSKNLIQNIGFGKNATHTMNENDKLGELQYQEINFPLVKNKEIMPDNFYDSYYFSLLPSPKNFILKFIESFIFKLLRKLKSI